MKKPLLSICIPTYNRVEQLKTTLESIASQKEFLDGEVEVVISDNASDDNTPIVGKDFASKFSNIHYYRNTYNVSDKNFPLVLSKANGVLRKLNNDTLILQEGSLSLLCNVISKYRKTKPLLFFSNGSCKCNSDEVLSFRRFVVQSGYWITWIGAFTIWEDDCMGIEDDTHACELQLWQVRKAYELGYKKDACVIINDVIGETQKVKKKNISYGLHKIFYNNFLSLLKPYVEKDSITTQEYELIRKDLLFNFFTNWIIKWELARNEMQFSEDEDLKKLVFNEYKEEPYWNEYKMFYFKRFAKAKIKMFITNIRGCK